MIENLIARFDHLSLRERLLAVAAVLVVLVAAFHAALIDRLDLRRKALAQELATLQGSMTAAATAVEAMNEQDATITALAQLHALQHDLEGVNAQLASEAAGMIEPQRMTQVVHDMLSRQHGVALISLRNLPAHSVVPQPGSADTGGPYVHPVEMVLEGNYLDVLTYLQGLEASPWRFYWRALDLQSGKYPLNRVRVELGTVSMTTEWLDL